MKVIVIGGGPAGMLSAISAAQENNEVIIFEKMNSLGKKLLITGKGRCNITSSIDIKDFIQNIPGNGKFLYSSFMNFTNKDIIKMLNDEGLQVKEERGNRVFPITDSAQDVLNALQTKLEKLNVKIELNSKVEKIIVKDNIVTGIIVKGKEVKANKVILATGGRSYSVTGSTGDGYRLAEEVGHNIVEIKPSLVPLEIYENVKCKQMQGLSLRNVAIKIKNETKVIYEDFGEMLFTHFGVSGPIIISSSAHLLRYKNIEQLLESKNIKLVIDLKPALTYEKLDARIIRDFESYKNKQFKNSLNELLPRKMIETVIEETGINSDKLVNEITKKERENLVKVLKEFELTVKDFRNIEEAIVTAGGIDIKQINPKTMESKIVNGLFFAGEVIDVDAYTGGFNLQIAYSTGVVAGKN